MISYAILLCMALALNSKCLRMLALSSVVGIGIFIPIPDTGFYVWCSLVEVCVCILAYIFSANASQIVMRCSVMLILFHVLGWWLNGYMPDSPYHLMVKITEHAELAACILLSHKITKRFFHARP